MDSLAGAIALGLLLGIQHATDPDHVVAVATVVSQEARFGRSALIGLSWGLGHTLTLIAVGGAIILLNLTVPPALARSMELLVALMLIALGAFRLFWTFRGSVHVHSEHLKGGHDHGHDAAFHSHTHAHAGVAHRHPHAHPSPRLLRALGAVGAAQAVRSLAIGVIHGLAGSAALALLVLSTIQSVAGALLYLGVFGVGTILGMTAITAALSVPFSLTAGRFAGINRAVSLGTGLLSLGLGFLLVYRIGLV